MHLFDSTLFGTWREALAYLHMFCGDILRTLCDSRLSPTPSQILDPPRSAATRRWPPHGRRSAPPMNLLAALGCRTSTKRDRTSGTGNRPSFPRSVCKGAVGSPLASPSSSQHIEAGIHPQCRASCGRSCGGDRPKLGGRLQ